MDVPVEKLATPWMERMEPGVEVPIPTEPFLSTISEVAVDEPTMKAGSPPMEFTDSLANGVDVPSPSLLFVSSQKNEDVDEA